VKGCLPVRTVRALRFGVAIIAAFCLFLALWLLLEVLGADQGTAQQVGGVVSGLVGAVLIGWAQRLHHGSNAGRPQGFWHRPGSLAVVCLSMIIAIAVSGRILATSPSGTSGEVSLPRGPITTASAATPSAAPVPRATDSSSPGPSIRATAIPGSPVLVAKSTPPTTTAVQQTLSVTIARPVDNGIVQHCSIASGTASNLPAGNYLWLVIQIPGASNAPDPGGYYLTKRLAAGDWQISPFEVGSSPDTGRPYWVAVYLLAASDSPPADQPGGRRSLPTGAQEEARVAVTRDPSLDNATGPSDPDYPGTNARKCA
jgi:hypothetical protein